MRSLPAIFISEKLLDCLRRQPVMSEPAAVCEIRPDDRVWVQRHSERDDGAVARVLRTLGVHQARVLSEASISWNLLLGRSAIDLIETVR